MPNKTLTVRRKSCKYSKRCKCKTVCKKSNLKKKSILDKPTVNGYTSSRDWKQETIDMYGSWPYDEDYHD